MFKHISELLSSFVVKQDEWKIKLFNNWDKVLGNLSDKVVILKAERHMLILGVTHPAWAHEMFMLSDVLKERINSLFGREQIKYIRFKIVKKQNVVKHIKKVERKKNTVENKKDLGLSRSEYLSLTKIKDPELKDFLKEFCLKTKRG